MKKKTASSRSSKTVKLAPVLSAALVFLASSEYVAAAIAPEEESKRLGAILKPIPDEIWTSVAGDKVTEKYTVVKGDTLYDISKRLFGDPKYWPKIWAINNNSITNPHEIKPGILIAFMPGTGTSLPAIGLTSPDQGTSAASPGSQAAPNSALAGSDEEEAAQPEKAPVRSEEWKLLPRQPWETIQAQLPPEVDATGFDRRSKVFFKTSNDFDLDAVVTSDPLEPSGQMIGGLSDASGLSSGDFVFFRTDSNLQIGEVYAITDAPLILNRGGDRRGFSYQTLGKAVILSVSEGKYVGRIVAARSPISRNSFLMPLPPRAKLIQPIPGPNPAEATIFFDSRFSTRLLGQFKEVFIDKGSVDGVQSGMVFRAYQTRDPLTRKTIAPEGVIPVADIMVVQVSPGFSAGFLMSTPNLIMDKTHAMLLTDVSDVGKPWAPSHHPESDELEKLEPGSPLKPEEQKELLQLERHHGEPKPGQPETPAEQQNGPEVPAPTSESKEAPPEVPGLNEPAPSEPAATLPPPAESPPAPETAPSGATTEAPPPPPPPAAPEAPSSGTGDTTDFPPPPPPAE